jgi:hypothetical protein
VTWTRKKSLHYDYYVASVRDAKKVHPGVVPWVKLPDTTLRGGRPGREGGRAHGVDQRHRQLQRESGARKASLLTLANVFMKELQADYTSAAPRCCQSGYA